MRFITIISISLFFLLSPTKAGNFEKWFTDKACRVDFHFTGNSATTSVAVCRIKQESFWGGRKKHTNEMLNLGEFRFQVTDSATNELIYADGFSSLFFEWQTTPEATRIQKSFENSLLFPYPRKAVKVSIEKRKGFDQWEVLSTFGISPDDKLIVRNNAVSAPVKEIQRNLPSDKAIDIAIIAEGYTIAEQEQFYADAQKLAENLFTHEPFAKYKSRINIYAIAAPSTDSGISMPHKNEWKNTALGSHFYTFYEPRYLTSPDMFTIRNYASLVPYDAVYILANTTTYGGGGIYNFYALASAHSERSKSEVVVHEFGHSFAGLADEYFYDKEDVFDEMYSLTEEPWEPNITTLVQFDKKWKNDLPKNTVIPTAVTDASKTQKIGVFEGGGYRTKGVYRPAYDCRMRTNNAKGFCSVCEKAVERMIVFLTE